MSRPTSIPTPGAAGVFATASSAKRQFVARTASLGPCPAATVTNEIHVTEARTADYVNGDSYVVPVGAMIDIEALEEQIATSRTYSPAALARDIDEAAQAVLAPHLAWNESSLPTELSLSLAVPALIDSRLTLSLTFASLDGPDVVFAASVTG